MRVGEEIWRQSGGEIGGDRREKVGQGEKKGGKRRRSTSGR